ncbi:oligosaccharide flippase family protein [Phytohabitans sp. ZYX-F-186]|uniref:Oligosaccharide flippase family protein n=1 Tax=Phytohabitans maris TaxID=3071409 RepID=A0ABU0ZP84_9ACTN|nr:oligosaccharide flippase family protein [Phytohabitans sp. ZYX-F-186]MDQ7908207.1 oligosaccharide flippase family protein [Phytohabitans sp. ZYX-F-186]
MTTATRPGHAPGPAARAVRLGLVTSGFNVASTAAAGVAGILIARSLGPAARGEYAAIMVVFVVLVVVGGLGQSAATTFFVARERDRAPRYLAVSRNLLLASGAATLVLGALAAPLFASGAGGSVWGYRLMFATCLAAFVGTAYLGALQAARIGRWNVIRICQPLAYLAGIAVLHAAGRLTLVNAVLLFGATTLAQTLLAWLCCARDRLTAGRPDYALLRPLARYGAGQLAATIPVVVVARLDQLAMAATVDPAVLGHYSVAASVTTLAVPVAAGLGYVAFPRIAAQRGGQPGQVRLQRRAVTASAGIGILIMAPLVLLAPWLVPALFGPGFRDSVLLVVLLAPGGVFLACQQVCADLLRGHGKPFLVARAQAVAAAVMVVLLAALLPTFGAPGAAVASSTAAATAFLLLRRALHRVLPPEQKEPTA